MQLRNFILIALAFDATAQECEAAHEAIDRLQGGVSPDLLVSATVNGTTGVVATLPAAVGTVAAITNSSQRDAAGFPWDERIHSSNKKLTDKGLWTMRRGCTPAQKASVEAELRNTLTSQPTASIPAPASSPSAQSGPPMPGANMPPMPGAAAVDPAYAALVKLLAENTQSSANPNGMFTDQYVKDVLNHYGVAEGSLQNLAHRPDLVPIADAWFRERLAD